MRIVDQKKEFSVEFGNAYLSVDGLAVNASCDNLIAQLGVYESRERAKEVFLDIHAAYGTKCVILKNIEPTEEVKSWFGESGAGGVFFDCDNSGESKVEFIGNSVYYMPES